MGVHKTAAGISGVLMVLGAAAGMAAGAFQVELRTPGWVDLTVTQAENLRNGAIELVESASFNTIDHADVLQQTPADVQRRFQAVATGPHVIVTLDQPRVLHSLNGDDTPVARILIGLDRTAQRTGGVFTIDQRGRLCGHEKYSGELLAELFELTDAIALRNSARSYAF
jgi:hypothetical protein